jgi:hypothetical protein
VTLCECHSYKIPNTASFPKIERIPFFSSSSSPALLYADLKTSGIKPVIWYCMFYSISSSFGCMLAKPNNLLSTESVQRQVFCRSVGKRRERTWISASCAWLWKAPCQSVPGSPGRGEEKQSLCTTNTMRGGWRGGLHRESHIRHFFDLTGHQRSCVAFQDSWAQHKLTAVGLLYAWVLQLRFN